MYDNGMKKELYKPFKSKAKNKKFSVYICEKDGKTKCCKLVHFGDSRYKHNYSTKARKTYSTKARKLTKDDRNRANYWARRVLWGA